MTAVYPDGRVLMAGARVHYVRNSSGGPLYPKVCRAAIVTGVHAPFHDGNVDLLVIDSEGFRNKHGVDGDQRSQPSGGTWHWPDPESARCTATTGSAS